MTGASGLLGARFAERALAKGHEVFSAYKEHPAPAGKRVRLDQTDEIQVGKTLSQIKPQAIINTAALSDVDFCEEHSDTAFKVNSESVSYLAEFAREYDSFLLQVSTDYVFDGEKGSYSELDPTGPVNKYGLSKLQGEKAAESVGEGRWCIARTSVVFGWGRSYRPNAATYVYEKLSRRETIRIVQDQYCSPTLNTNLAAMLIEIIERKLTGILHTAGASRLNRHELAQGVADIFGLDPKLVLKAEAKDASWRAKRPRDSSLDVTRAMRLLTEKPYSIQTALRQFSLEQSALDIKERH